MFKNAKIISFFTIISRIFGYLRDFIIAKYFGTTIYTDMFFIVFRMPNSLRRFLGEGAINSSVVPVLSKIDDKDRAKAVWNIIILFTIILFVVATLGVIFSKELIAVFSAGFLHSEQFQLMDSMVKITFPYIFIVGLYVLLMGILNTFNRFAYAAFAPTLLNVGIILSVYFLFSQFTNPVYSLCVGVLFGGVLQLLAVLYDFSKLKLKFHFSLKIEDSTKEMLKLMSITALGGGVFQIASMIDAFMASFMASGSFSYLFYANRLFQLPFAVFSIALTQSSLPDLSKLNKNELIDKLHILTKFVSFISIFVTLYFLFFGKVIIKLLFEHGRFNQTSTLNTYYALAFMILGFFFFSQTKILSNAFYAVKDAKTPLKASIFAALASIVFSIVLGLEYGFKGLACAVTISGFVNMLFLVKFINKEFKTLSFNNFFDYKLLLIFFILTISSFIIHALNFEYIIEILLSSLLYTIIFYFNLTNYIK